MNLHKHTHTRAVCAMPRFHIKLSTHACALAFSLGNTFGAHRLINCEILPLKGKTHTHTHTHSNTQNRLLLPKDKTNARGTDDCCVRF